MPASNSISRIRTGLLAAVIAVLVWAFAEGESVSTRTVIATVNFPTEPTGNVLIRPDDPQFHGTASVRLEGSTRTIDTAAAIVGNKLRLVPGLQGVPNTPGKQYVDLRAAISSIPELRGIGSTVAEVDPPVVNVDVIRMASDELNVRVELDGSVVLDGEPVCSPPTVTIRVPEELLGRIPKNAVAIATISDQDLRTLRAEEAQSVTATVRLPSECAAIEHLVATPEQVTVTLRLKRTLDTLKIPTVPVWFSMPPNEDAGKWIVELEDKFITNVTFSGPSEQLERMRSGAWPVKALIELSSDELVKGVKSKKAIFPELPPGVTASAENRDVRLARITRREPSH